MGASPEDSRVGEVIGPYELRERVRAGDLSETFRAFDRHGDRWVTLTRLRPEVALRGNVVSEFVRDAEALASIDHPGLVPVSRGEDDLGLPFTVREDVAGELLSSLLERHPKGLELQVAMSIASQIAGALAEVHARGAVHGNPGAGYVLLTDHSGTGAPVLVGFGMSDASAMLGVSPERALAVPPECLMGGEPDASSDVYSFAAMVYEMVSGEAPPAEGAALQAEVDDVPASLSRMVQRCLCAQRERRPSIGELRAVLIELAPRKSEFPAPQNIRRISTTFRPPSVPDVAPSAPAARPSSADTVTGPEALLDLASELASDPPPAAATTPSSPAPDDDSFAGLLGEGPVGGEADLGSSDTVLLKPGAGDDSFAGVLDAASSNPPMRASDPAVTTSLAPSSVGQSDASLPPPSAWSESLDSVPPALRGASSGPPRHSPPPAAEAMRFSIPSGAGPMLLGHDVPEAEGFGQQGGDELSIPPPAQQTGDDWKPSRFGYDEDELDDRHDDAGEFSIPPPAEQTGDGLLAPPPSVHPPADAGTADTLLLGDVPPLPPARPPSAAPPLPPKVSAPPPVPPAARKSPPTAGRPAPPPRRVSAAPKAPVAPPALPERASAIEEALASGTLGGGSWGGSAAVPAAARVESMPAPTSVREEPDEETLARRRERRRRRRPVGAPEGLPMPMIGALALWVLLASLMAPMIFAVDVSLVQSSTGVDGRVVAVVMLVLGVMIVSRVLQGARAAKSANLMASSVLMGIALGGLSFLTLELFLPPESLGPLQPIARLSATWGLAFTLLSLCGFAVAQIRSPKLNLSMSVAVLLGVLALESLFGTAWVISRSLRVADGTPVEVLYYAD